MWRALGHIAGTRQSPVPPLCPHLHPSFSWLQEVGSAPREALLLCTPPVMCVLLSEVAGGMWHLVDAGPVVASSAEVSSLGLKSEKMDLDFFPIYH